MTNEDMIAMIIDDIIRKKSDISEILVSYTCNNNSEGIVVCLSCSNDFLKVVLDFILENGSETQISDRLKQDQILYS